MDYFAAVRHFILDVVNKLVNQWHYVNFNFIIRFLNIKVAARDIKVKLIYSTTQSAWVEFTLDAKFLLVFLWP